MDKETTYRRQAYLQAQEFKSLPIGWDYGRGTPATDVAVSSVDSLLDALGQEPFTDLLVRVFPQFNGGITVHLWVTPANLAEIRVDPSVPERYDIAQECEEDGVIDIPSEETDIDLQSLLQEIRRIFSLWNSSELLTRKEHSTPMPIGLPLTVSSTTRAVSLFSQSTAPSTTLAAFAATLSDTTYLRLATQSNTGFLTRRYYMPLPKSVS